MMEKLLQVKKILDSIKTKNGKRLFQVEWSNSWEEEEYVSNIAPNLVDQFLKQNSESLKDETSKQEVENPNLKDKNDEQPHNLFAASDSAELAKQRKGGGGINAIISRLQKNQKEGLAKNKSESNELKENATLQKLEQPPESFPPHQQTSDVIIRDSSPHTYVDTKSHQHFHNERYISYGPNARKPRIGELPRYEAWYHEDGKSHSKYAPKYPLSPPEGLEAKEGMLPTHSSASSHYTSMPPPQVSPQYSATSPRQMASTPPRRRNSSSSSNSLQSLKSNVDNIQRLFPEDPSEHRSDGYYDNGTNIQALHPAVVLKCNICSDVFYEEIKFKQHMFMHEQVSLLKQEPPKLLKPGTFECKFCHMIFDDKDKLKVHYSELHEKEFVHTQPMDQLYQCSLCEQTFVDYSKLVQHHQTHQQSRREVFILPKMQQEKKILNQGVSTVNTDQQLAQHNPVYIAPYSPQSSSQISPVLYKSTQHSTSPPVNIKYEEDDNVFLDEKQPSMTTLDFQPVNEALISKSKMSISELVDEVKKMFRCNLCDEMFPNEHDRAKHSLIHVNRSTSLDCHVCGKQFRHRTNLTTHLIVHSGVKPHQCQICLRRFTQKVNLQRHMHIHDGSRPFACMMCSKSFTQKANLQRHILSHIECSKDELQQALNDIPNESEVNSAINESLAETSVPAPVNDTNIIKSEKIEFRCDICDKTFAQKVNLQKHMLIHSGSRPFQCYVCGKAFRQRASLQKHYTVHTNGSSSFICQTCNRLFVSRTNLQRHMLVHAVPGTAQCFLCDQKFNNTDNLERHFSEHIEEASPNVSLPQKYFEQSTPGQAFRCATCDIVFDSPIIFSQHLQCHQRGFSPDTTPNDIGDVTKAYEENQVCPLQCNACGMIFMSVAKLDAHMLTHADTLADGSKKHATGVMISSEATNVTPAKESSTYSSSSTAPNFITEKSTSPSTDEVSTKVPTTRVSRCPVCKEKFPSKVEMRVHFSVAHIEIDDSKSKSTSSTMSEMSAESLSIASEKDEDASQVEVKDVKDHNSKLTESEETTIQENKDFIRENILGGSEEYDTKETYERGNYSCKICNRVLTYKYSLDKHMLLHIGNFPYKCHLCSKRFNHKNNFDIHVLIHNNDKPFMCNICQRPFSQRSNLQRHQQSHSQNRDFICDVCGKRFNHMASLKTHSLIHTGAKPFSCYICTKRFNQKGNLKRHIQTHRTGKRNKVKGVTNAPKECYESINDDNMLASDDEMKLETSLSTSSEFPRKSLRKIIKKDMSEYDFYDDDEPLPTMISGNNDFQNDSINTSNNSDTLYNDLEEEENDILTVVPSDVMDETQTVVPPLSTLTTPLKCDSCSELFFTAESLEDHKRERHFVPCNICGRRFSQKANLLKHKLIHANKKPYQCKICKKAFRQKANLQRHELIHDKERKPISCKNCSKTFRCTWSLKQHMKTHVEEGSFGCSICGMVFKQSALLKRHFLVHTQNNA